MKQTKIIITCVALLFVFTAILAAGEGNDDGPEFVRILQLGDGSRYYESSKEVVENESGNLKKMNEWKRVSGNDLSRDEQTLQVNFDYRPKSIYVYNDLCCFTKYDFEWNDDMTYAYMSIPEGTYDIFVHFFSDEYTNNTFMGVINEDVAIQEETTLNIETTDADCYVDLETVDEDWNIISSDDVFLGDLVVEIQTPMATMTNFSLIFSSTPEYCNFDRIKLSSVSENYSFRIIETKLLEDKVYEVTFDDFEGIEDDMELSNVPMYYLHTQASFAFDSDVDHYLSIGSGWVDSDGYSCFYSPSYDLPIENNDMYDVYMIDVTNPALSEYAFSFFVFMDEEYYPVISTPSYFITQDEHQVACAYHRPPANCDGLVETEECLDFNMTLPYVFTNYSKNNYTGSPCIKFSPRVYGSQNQWLGINQIYSNYEVLHGDEVIDSGQYMSWGGLQDLSAETYSFVLYYDSYYIEGMQGSAEYNFTFDLGAGDPDSPYLTSLQIKNEEGKAVTTLPENGEGTIELTAANFIYDEESYIYSDVSTAEVLYKAHDYEDWEELEVYEESALSDSIGGQYFIGDMSSVTSDFSSGTYVDLMIIIEDETGNSNVQTFMPALYVSSVSVDDPVDPSQSSIISSIGPNPFNDNTTIRFSLSKPSSVRMDVYNVRGEKVRTLVDEELEADSHVVNWDGKDSLGKRVSSGIYFCKIKADNETETRKMMLVH